MTDLATAPGAASASDDAGKTADGTTPVEPALPEAGDSDGDRPVEWAPSEPAPKKRRIGLWIGIGIGVLAIGAGAASTVLIAPGVTIAGVPVGGMTVGAAAEALSSRVSSVQVHLDGAGSGAVVSGSDLGARIDATRLAEQAFAAHPMWNITSWMPSPGDADITLDAHSAERVLRAQVPSVYQNPTDAAVAFNPAAKAFGVTAGTPGTGIDLDALDAAITAALAKGESKVDFEAKAAPVQPDITDAEAKAAADKLNGMLGSIGFYAGTERTVPIDPAVAATWLSAVPQDGALVIKADQSAIQKAVAALPGQVNRPAVNATSVVDSTGDVLDKVTAGVAGRELGDVSGAAAAFATQLQSGNAAFELPVKEVPFQTTSLLRKIDVNLSTETLTVTENGAVVDSWAVSSGAGSFATQTGNYAVNWKLSSQDMGNKDTTKAPFYFQPDVKWVMYFNGDEAFHGVYWHDNWGVPMSHGCVGMPEWRAQWLFDWSPQGTEVSIHY